MTHTSIKKNRSILSLTQTSKHKNAYIFAALVALSASQATAENTQRDNSQIGKAIVSGGTIGAIVGGPFGFGIGVIGSALINDQVIRHKKKSAENTNAAEMIVNLQEELIEQQQTVSNLEGLVHERLSLEILFKTGVDTPSEADIEKLQQLSNYLKANRGFKIELSGHADITGTDEYNNVLSLERAKSVANILDDEGIPQDNISTKGFGSSRPASSGTSEDHRASDRRVNINIVFEDKTVELATLKEALF